MHLSQSGRKHIAKPPYFLVLCDCCLHFSFTVSKNSFMSSHIVYPPPIDESYNENLQRWSIWANFEDIEKIFDLQFLQGSRPPQLTRFTLAYNPLISSHYCSACCIYGLTTSKERFSDFFAFIVLPLSMSTCSMDMAIIKHDIES